MTAKLANFRGFEDLPNKIGQWNGSTARNAATESRIAKEKHEKEIQDAVDAKLKEIEDNYQKFYLLEDNYANRVLKLYSASEKSLGKTVPASYLLIRPRALLFLVYHGIQHHN